MTSDLNWADTDLVAFDVDGTLYDQNPIRLRMIAELCWQALQSLSLRDIHVVRTYRREREIVGDEGAEPFEPELLRRVAVRCGQPVDLVAVICAEWLQQRALPHLPSAVFPGVHQLFARLRERGKKIAVYSDYPAAAKLQAMGLHADIVVSAHDDDVAVLKPNPKGLIKILELGGTSPQRALLIGDRIDREAVVARSAGVACLIKQRQPVAGVRTFSSFLDDVFLRL